MPRSVLTFVCDGGNPFPRECMSAAATFGDIRKFAVCLESARVDFHIKYITSPCVAVLVHDVT